MSALVRGNLSGLSFETLWFFLLFPCVFLSGCIISKYEYVTLLQLFSTQSGVTEEENGLNIS